MNRDQGHTVEKWAFRACQVYLLALGMWFAAYQLSGDRIGYLGLVNALAVHLFWPLPLALLAGLLLRRRALWLGSLLGLLVFAVLWGGQFAPGRWPGTKHAEAAGSEAGHSGLRVMTYNVMAMHTFTQPVLDNIRAEDPDVVFLQEVNTNLARTLQSELGELYPYQILAPADNYSGMGVISKYPLAQAAEQLPRHYWVGPPQTLVMDWNGQPVTLVNFHMTVSTRPRSPELIDRQFRAREDQARLMLELAQRSQAAGAAAIVAGDANAAPLNDSIRMMSGQLHDAWQEAGFGLGHTFPGFGAKPSQNWLHWLRQRTNWLVRIDYIFYAGDWQTASARLAPHDGVSDHRGVVAELVRK